MTQSTAGTGQAAPWVPDDSTFGARLALIRQHMKWGNVAEAARECGVPTDSWRNWEVDGREPRRLVTIAMAIATRTGVDVDWLIRGRSGTGKNLTLGYPRNLAELAKLPTPAALRARVVVPHGDGRRRKRRLPTKTGQSARYDANERPKTLDRVALSDGLKG